MSDLPPTRHPLNWKDPEFCDSKALDEEMRRVFDVCHGCRRCFNLCDSFPRLFDLIDATSLGEVEEVQSSEFSQVVDACTLCDQCFMAKCPYVPPHEFNIDFPHLMLRYRYVHKDSPRYSILANVDQIAPFASALSPLTNAFNKNATLRAVLEKTLHIDANAPLPAYHQQTLLKRATKHPYPPQQGPAWGEKVVVYATCFGNYNQPDLGMKILALLSLQGVETKVIYPGCCGMPLLEQAKLEHVEKQAKEVTQAFIPWIDKGYRVLALVPSCTLMLKIEWPLLLPLDPEIRRLSESTVDVCEYFVDLRQKYGWEEGLHPIEGAVSAHIACHAQAQNMGKKAAEMLRFIPGIEDVQVIERCSGHGGLWGISKDHLEIALKIGAPVAKTIETKDPRFVVSECPLAASHIEHMLKNTRVVTHPIEILYESYFPTNPQPNTP